MGNEVEAPRFVKGDIVYMSCRESDTGEVWLAKSEILDVVQTYTPTGRPRPPAYKVLALNYRHVDNKEYEDKCLSFEKYNFRSAVEATSEGLKTIFSGLSDSSPETRLLNAIFGKPEVSPVIRPDMLGLVISDLLKFHKMLIKAYEIDNEALEKKACGQGIEVKKCEPTEQKA